MNMDSRFLEQLHDPPKRFRPIPFWSWNEKLDVAETRRQIAEMDRVGIGGYFMHARGGLQTPYLGSEWMANVAAGIDEARKRGMGAWAYDENGWPSGFGDGKVNGRGEAFQQKYLRCEIVSAETHRADGRTIANLILADGRRAHFYYDVNPFYVDTLDREVARVFLEEVYEPHRQRFGGDFGEAMPGFFTDEPQVSRNGIPWSLTLPDAYRDAYGEELLEILPHLFMETGAHTRTRYRFWHLVQELFVVNFTQQISEWCARHGALLTGHMVLEETLLSQITSNAAVMPHYEFFHMPGMDWLGRHIDPPTTPVQVASVAHQMGRRRILSETFALTGWNVAFDELKWMFEWQMVRGITQLCQHLEGYSLRGVRKRDYPPSLFFQQPWWGDRYRAFNDAMSRVGMLLAEGEIDFDVLVLHPQSSAWLRFNNGDNGRLSEDLFRPFLELTKALEGAHVPFHYGDERILRRHGRVEGKRLRVGTQVYRAVIVPPVDTLAGSTVELLTRYAKNGGLLIWAGQQPTLVEGTSSGALPELCADGVHAMGPRDAVSALPPEITRISATDELGREIAAIAVTRRSLPSEVAGEQCTLYFFANADMVQGYEATVRVPGRQAVRVAIEDGGLRGLPSTVEGDRVSIPFFFPAGGSLLILVSDRDDAFSGVPSALAAPPRTPLGRDRLGGKWQLELIDPNALTLDTCAFWFDGALQAENEHVSVIQKRALDLERPVQIRMRFRVRVAPGFTPPGEVHLVLEQPRRCRVQVNGAPVAPADRGWYRDTAFRKLDISGRLRPGVNQIEITTDFRQSPEVYENLKRARLFEAEKNKLTYDSEIETAYLIGDFAVATPGVFEPLERHAMRYRGEFVLGPLPAAVTLGDLTPQGLPFFNGTVRLRKVLSLPATEIENRSFRFVRKMASGVGLRVNGEAVAEWLWRPYETDLSERLQPGENVFELELVGNLRNLLGPHHLVEGESYSVAPSCFFKEPNLWGAQPWTDDYCFVEFGLEL